MNNFSAQVTLGKPPLDGYMSRQKESQVNVFEPFSYHNNNF
jgi:hypothetical protein